MLGSREAAQTAGCRWAGSGPGSELNVKVGQEKPKPSCPPCQLSTQSARFAIATTGAGILILTSTLRVR